MVAFIHSCTSQLTGMYSGTVNGSLFSSGCVAGWALLSGALSNGVVWMLCRMPSLLRTVSAEPVGTTTTCGTYTQFFWSSTNSTPRLSSGLPDVMSVMRTTASARPPEASGGIGLNFDDFLRGSAHLWVFVHLDRFGSHRRAGIRHLACNRTAVGHGATLITFYGRRLCGLCWRLRRRSCRGLCGASTTRSQHEAEYYKYLDHECDVSHLVSSSHWIGCA